MSTMTLKTCNAIREQHYPRDNWPGLLYEAAVAQRAGCDSVLLEIGCGREGKRLSRMTCNFRLGIGIDMEVAAQLNGDGKTRLILGDAHRIALASRSVDVISMANVAEHLADPVAVFRECHRVLKPNGRLVVMTVNQFFPPIAFGRLLPHGLRRIANRIASGTREEDTFPAYYRANTARALAACARQSGFAVDKVRYLPHHPHYLMFSTIAYRLGILLERTLRPIAGLRHMILGVFSKPESTPDTKVTESRH